MTGRPRLSHGSHQTTAPEHGGVSAPGPMSTLGLVTTLIYRAPRIGAGRTEERKGLCAETVREGCAAWRRQGATWQEIAYLKRVTRSLGTTKEPALERMLSAGWESEGQAGRGLKVELRGLI